MSEWKEYKLEDVCDAIYSGGTPSSMVKEYWNGSLPWLSSGETSQRYIFSTEKCITQEGVDNSSTRYAYKDSTVVASAGQGHTRGQASLLCINTYVNQSVIVLKPNEKRLNPYFLYYNIDNRYNELRQLSDGTSTRGSLSGKILKELPIKIPSLVIQSKIASILKSLDDKIEVNKRISDNLEQQAQALFKHWFVDFAPFKDGKFVESELGMIPEGWRVGTLGDICVTNKRTYGSSSLGIIEYIDTGSVTNNKIDNIQILDPKIDKIPSRARRAITEGDILFSSVRPNQRHFAFMYNPNSRMVASTGFVVITANWSGYRYYIYQYLVQDSVINYLQAIAEQSVSTYPSINASDITNIKVIIPPDDIIRDYASILSRFMGEIDRNNQESSRLSTLRDTLLPKLMSGQIKVNDIKI